MFIVNSASYFSNLHALPIYVVGLSILAGGIFLYLKNKSIVTLSFLFCCLSVAVWLLATATGYISKDINTAAFWFRVDNFGVMFISVSCLFFTKTVLGDKEYRNVIAGYLIAFILGIAAIQTNWLVTGAKQHFWGFFPTWGPLSIPVLTLFFGYMGGSLFILSYRYLKGNLTPLKKNQIRYIIIAYLIGYTGSVDFLPTLGVEIYPFGYISILLFLLIIAFAIVKYRLMDIKVAFTRAGIFIVVYTVILGAPLFLGYKYGLWHVATWSMLIFATSGPFIYNYLRRRAEDLILKDQRLYQLSLTELSKNASRIRDLDELLRAIVLTVSDKVKVSFAAIYLHDPERKSYQLKNYFPPKAKDKLKEDISVASSAIDKLKKDKKPLVAEETSQPDLTGLDFGLIIPCFVQNELYGFLVLGTKPNNRMYTYDDLILFEGLSYSTALAIENCIFWREIEDRQRKARLQEMDTFSYSLAHEIDNPMQVILGEAGLLQKEYLKDIPDTSKHKEITESFSFIIEAALRVSKLVKAIRDFGQQITGQFKPILLTEIIESFSRLYSPQFKANSVIFKADIPETIGYIRGEKAELMQVLVILANNSLHAMKDSSSKEISLKAETLDNSTLKLSFSDTGCGIKQELIPTIFSSFTTTKPSSEGTGMGLYNAKKIIQRHRGTIHAESEGENKGATFIIELPLATDITPEELVD